MVLKVKITAEVSCLSLYNIVKWLKMKRSQIETSRKNSINQNRLTRKEKYLRWQVQDANPLKKVYLDLKDFNQSIRKNNHLMVKE